MKSYEYKTTTAPIADFYNAQGARIEETNLPLPPIGVNWELVSTCANNQVVLFTWRRASR